MHVLILHDSFGPEARSDVLDALTQARVVGEALTGLGHRSATLAFDWDLGAASAAIQGASPDVVFNLVESVHGLGRLIYLAPALLDAIGVPYVGVSTEAMFITSNKLLTKRFLRAHGVATPDWFDPGDVTTAERFVPGRYIIKSVWEEASVGLDEDSIVEADSPKALEDQISRRLVSLGGAAFAEAFIDGREFNVALLSKHGAEGTQGLRDEGTRRQAIGNRQSAIGPGAPGSPLRSENSPEVLPIAEIDFIGYAADKPKVVGYRAKWDESSYEYHHTPRRFEFPQEDAALLSELRRIAQDCWRNLGLRGWVRVDFRVDHEGRSFVLEVNANPCLSPDAGFSAALAQAGIPFPVAIERILSDASAKQLAD